MLSAHSSCSRAWELPWKTGIISGISFYISLLPEAGLDLVMMKRINLGPCGDDDDDDNDDDDDDDDDEKV